MTDTIAEEQKTRQPDQRNCKHHWVIKTPNGARALGRCKLCGLQRRFSTAPDRLSWGETRLGQFSAPAEVS